MARRTRKPNKQNSSDQSAKASYSAEFKETAIKLASVGDKSIAEVARELGLPEWKLYGWVQSWKKTNGKQSGGKTSAEDELRRLQKRNKELEVENEILKKASAYFARTLL